MSTAKRFKVYNIELNDDDSGIPDSDCTRVVQALDYDVLEAELAEARRVNVLAIKSISASITSDKELKDKLAKVGAVLKELMAAKDYDMIEAAKDAAERAYALTLVPIEHPLLGLVDVVSKEGVCIHGGLRRQCETCDLAYQLEKMTKERDARAAYAVRAAADDAWDEIGSHNGPGRKGPYKIRGGV